jgi:hypothetical protein
MWTDGALILVLDALRLEAQKAKEAERDALFVQFAARDKQRDVQERDARIDELRKSQEVVRDSLRDVDALRKRVPDLEQHLFDSERRNKQLEDRLGKIAQELTASFEARMTRARTVALDELEAHAKQMYALLPVDASVQMIELIEAMRLVVAKNVH